MFRTVPLSISRCFSLYTQQRYMSYRFADSLRAGSGRNVLMLFQVSDKRDNSQHSLTLYKGSVESQEWIAAIGDEIDWLIFWRRNGFF